MEGSEKSKNNLDDTKQHLDVLLTTGDESNLNSIHDKVLLQILQDSMKENDEPLKVIETRIWDPGTKTAEFDVKDSTVLKLMFGKPLQ